MSTTSTRLGLVKPLTSENYDVTIVNGNSDKVDAAIGFSPVTSGTRPAAPFNGQTIRETDTGKTYFHNGAVPASSGWVQIPNVASNIDLGSAVQITWGGDTTLFRSAAGTLRTGGAFIANGAMTASAGLTVVGNESVSGSAATAGNMTIGGTLNVVGTITQAGKPLQLKNRIFSGQISIIPVAGTPTSGVLTYGTTLDGTVFRAQATAATGVPGSTVLGVGVTPTGASACTVYVTRSNTTSTLVNVLVIGSDT